MSIDHWLLAVSTSTTIGTWVGVGLLLRQRGHQRRQWEQASEAVERMQAVDYDEYNSHELEPVK